MISDSALIEFYERCESEQIFELDDAYKEKKAERIATVMNIDASNGIQQIFSTAKSITLIKREEKRIAQRSQEQSINLQKAKREDPKDLLELSKYSDLYGVDKITEMVS